jgi:hypothetical protein
MARSRKKRALNTAANRLAVIFEEHLATLSPADQMKRIKAARTLLARARAKRRATPSTPASKTPTPVAAQKRG